MACASSCRTQDHGSYGECLRDKGLSVMGLESTGNGYGGRTADLKMHAENAAYASARAEGLQPKAPTMKAVDAAKRAADVKQSAD